MKLFYFDAPGGAESIRLLLTHVGAKYEDVRIPPAEWLKYKNQFELKQVPSLEIDGRVYNQTNAILEYLGLKFGLLPTCHHELYSVLFVMNTAEDLFNKAFQAATPASVLDAKGKEEALKKLVDTEGPLLLTALDKKLKANSSKDFIVGSKYTIADFVLLGYYTSLLTVPDWNKAFFEKIKLAYPELIAYLDKRMKDFNAYYKKCKKKLYYFDMPGRGEMVRVMLKHMKLPFEDVRIKLEEWPKLKCSGKFELQQLPVLECEPCGVNYCQADAIMHKFGLRYGYLPTKCPEKLFQIVWWCNTLKDVMNTCGRFKFAPLPAEMKAKMAEDFFTKVGPTLIAAMENRLKMNDNQLFLVGKSYTIADFYCIGVCRGYIMSPIFPQFKELIEKAPVFKAYFEAQSKLL